jgi:GntR family uxuAB operon transcriptional repressor
MTDLSNLAGPSDAEAADRSYIGLARQIHAMVAAGALEAAV